MMEVERVLRMKGGDGEKSYAKNSTFQKEVLDGAKKTRQEAILNYCNGCVDSCGALPEVLSMAELGCASGPNACGPLFEVLSTIKKRCLELRRPPPMFQLFLNDLPGNDFNSVFRMLPNWLSSSEEDEGRCLVAGVPGSFYRRLFPDGSIHFLHSSYSLHWLSQVPPELKKGSGTIVNKGKVFLSKGSPEGVVAAYYKQFQRDFSTFLGLRAKELVPGGRMVLVFLGRRLSDPAAMEHCFVLEFFALVLMAMVSEGIIEEEKLNSFNFPIYFPSTDELHLEIQKEGSFAMKHIEILDVQSPTIEAPMKNIKDDIKQETPYTTGEMKGKVLAKHLRAVFEPMVAAHMGEDIMDDLFARFQVRLAEYYSTRNVEPSSIMMSLEKK